MPKTRDAFAFRNVIDYLDEFVVDYAADGRKIRLVPSFKPFAEMKDDYNVAEILNESGWGSNISTVGYRIAITLNLWFDGGNSTEGVRYGVAGLKNYQRLQRLRFLEEITDRHIGRLQEYVDRIFGVLLDNQNERLVNNGRRSRELLGAYKYMQTLLLTYEGALKLEVKNELSAQQETTRLQFGERLRQARQNKQLTLDDVARMLNITKVGVSQYERGMREPPLWTVRQMMGIFGISADWLFGA